MSNQSGPVITTNAYGGPHGGVTVPWPLPNGKSPLANPDEESYEAATRFHTQPHRHWGGILLGAVALGAVSAVVVRGLLAADEPEVGNDPEVDEGSADQPSSLMSAAQRDI